MKRTNSLCLGFVVVAAAALLTASCSGEPDLVDGENNANNKPTSAQCERDEANRAEDAVALTAGESTTGYICPIADKDWYRFSVPASDRVVQVSLALASALSQLELTYEIWSTDAAGKAIAAVSRPLATAIGEKIDTTECIAPGTYALVVRDHLDSAQDVRHRYELVVNTLPDPDSNEPNDDASKATAIVSGQAKSGTVACRGDEDWFAIDVPARHLMRVRLTSAKAAYEPTFSVKTADGETVVRESNLSGSVKETALDRYVGLSGAGRYFVVVSDDNGLHADPKVPYQLTVDLIEDRDTNEPNNSAATATPLSQNAVSCGTSWSSTMEFRGTIGAPGDNDWYRLPLQGCEKGIIEAEMVFDTASMSNEQQWEFASKLQATLTMIRPHEATSCTADAQCAALEMPCSENLGCAGYFETCRADRKCAGALVCLPEGVCGANQVQRRYACSNQLPECQPSAAPAPGKNQAIIAAPLFGENVVYLRASDFQAQAAMPDVFYTLRVRVRNDPDDHEPSNLFTNLVQNPLPISRHQSFATEIPVHDCTGEQPECCSGGTWIRGHIAYESDQDWYKYEHPCRGDDCTLRFHYRVDAGPVDVVMNIYRGGSLWYTIFDNEQRDTQPAINGVLGGMSAQNKCFYGSKLHNGDYYLHVRDIFELYSDRATVKPESRNWSADQSYSFCVEKISNQCEVPPCKLFDNGCGL
ncbi:MAG: hypothetical protein H0U74_23485 [Bradymonadaceae bacterium]|nr:hypothetical protein [Lujinxingiaceae bacterium]